MLRRTPVKIAVAIVLGGLSVAALIWFSSSLYGTAAVPKVTILNPEVCLRQVLPAADILRDLPLAGDEWTRLLRMASSTPTTPAMPGAHSFSDYGLRFVIPPDWQAASQEIKKTSGNYSLVVKLSAPPLRPGLSRLPILTLIAAKTGWASLIPEVIVSPSTSLKTVNFFVGSMQYRLAEDPGFLLPRDTASLVHLLSTLTFTCLGE